MKSLQGPENKERKEHDNFPVIHIWLDSYDEIFSDFDPRPYQQRVMSDDFIIQTRKITREHSGEKFILRLLLPEKVRKHEVESVINKRLQQHFNLSWKQLYAEKRATIKRGTIFTAAGIFLMIAGSLVSYYNREQNYYAHLLLILFEPSGWFLFWTGLDGFFTFSKMKSRDIEFYRTMKKAKIEFGSY